jgi:hypothetical protein
MTKVMYDATSPRSIPYNVPPPDYAMGYSNGRWPSFTLMILRFPDAVPVKISAIPGKEDGSEQGFDGEKGDYSPEQAALAAVHTLDVRKIVPFIYCSLSDWPAYQQAVRDLGLEVEQVDWIIAAYPGNGPNLYPGAIGHQWIDRGTYDESVIADGWIPGRPISSPLPPETEDMDNITFIHWLYRFLLYRAPDAAGLATWNAELNKGAARGEVFAVIQNSPEGVAALNAQRKSLGMGAVSAP